MTRVEIDIFSGRPNPAWTLSAAEAAALARLLAQLPPGAAPKAVGLGYRGFVVSDGSGGTTRVFAATVTSAVGQHHADANGAERWLFDNARSHGHGPLVDAIAPR